MTNPLPAQQVADSGTDGLLLQLVCSQRAQNLAVCSGALLQRHSADVHVTLSLDRLLRLAATVADTQY